jgi:uncharacterized protein YydD (DUF2326 family)
MVILKRLFSETGLFDPVKFNLGINIVLGEYTRPKEERSELNGIGKSTLIRLIDYALLSDTTRRSYFNTNQTKYDFLKDHSIILELEIEGKSYFIKRSFSEPKTPQFGNDVSCLQTYQENELRTILGNLFFGKDEYQGYFESNWFRTIIRFFIKDDINNYERKDPLKFSSSHINNFEAYLYNLFLLGLPNKAIGNYEEFKKKRNEINKQHKGLSNKLKEETGKEIQQINSEIRVLDNKIRNLEKALDEYKFLQSYKDVEDELVKLSGEISENLRKINLFKRRLDEYKQSYEYEIEIDKEKITRAYSEIKQVFGDSVKKTLEDIFSFRKKISEGRERFLKSKEVELTTEIDKITDSISSLETRRSDLYKMLDEKKALDSLKNNYSLLIEEKSKRERLNLSINQLDKLDEEKSKLNVKISNTVSEIRKEITKVDDQIGKLYTIFLEIVTAAIRVTNIDEVVFDIRPYSNTNSPFKITIDVPKSEALGKTRLKVLAYDLTVFFNIIHEERNLPYFLIHDGAFHAIDKKTIIGLLNYIHTEFLKHPKFQYIITANEDEIDVPSDKIPFYGDFNYNISDCIIARYKDIPEGMIFKREF